MRNHHDTMGALYVHEGSTLGGPHIVEMISKRAQISKDAFHIFQDMASRIWQCGMNS